MAKRTKKTPQQREAIRHAFWNKWAGTAPAEVIWTKGITNDPWNSVTYFTENMSDLSDLRFDNCPRNMGY